MSTILDQIVASKRDSLSREQAETPLGEQMARVKDAPPVRDFLAALTQTPHLGIIAEVKRASPSAGVLREDFDPVAIARLYEIGGANCISVLTDEPYFHGRLEYLTAIRQAVTPPVLRKDFIIDRYQVAQARAAGADAVLLIAEILTDAALVELLDFTHECGMQALVELYDPENVARVVRSGARLIGINNRNLRTFETRLEHTLDLAPRIPSDRCLVSESGIQTPADMGLLKSGGVRAVLIGETLMRSGDPVRVLAELRI